MGLFDFLFSKKDSNKTLAPNFQELVKFKKGNQEWYTLAFTHKSTLHKADRNTPENSNERLEFLGDAVLDSVVSDYLFNTFPQEDEGFLTRTRSKIVSRNHLSKIALEIGIDTFLKSSLGKNDHAKSIHGNALEALIGAIYMDKGYKESANFIHRIMLSKKQIEKLLQAVSDYKSKLLEWGQQHKIKVYFDTQQSNNLQFHCKLYVNNKIEGSGEAKNKKQAEQIAAKEALEKITTTN